MRLDSILEKELKNRLQKENRAVVFVTRVKMMVLFEGVEWQPNCSGLLVLYQKKYSHGFTILDASNFDVNFDFELYSNFQSYTKYFPDTFSLAFMAPSSEKSLKIMFLFENKAELVEIKKHLDRIFNPNTGKIDIDFFNQPQVIELLGKVPIDENLLGKDLTMRQEIEAAIRTYLSKIFDSKGVEKVSGFKYYALSKDSWKTDNDDKQFMKEALQGEIVETLTQLQKQAKLRTSKKEQSRI